MKIKRKIFKTYPINQAIIINEIASTNNFCKDNIENQLQNEPYFVLSRRQSKGRGQALKSWIDFGPANIFLSISLNPEYFKGTNPISPFWSLLAGYSVRKAIIEVMNLNIIRENQFYIKWPNDLIYIAKEKSKENYKKIAGILCETIFHGNRLKKLIIGIGINVSASAKISQDKNYISILRQMESEQGYVPGFLRKISEKYHSDNISKGKIVSLILKNSLTTLNDFLLADDVQKRKIVSELNDSLLWKDRLIELNNYHLRESAENSNKKTLQGILLGIEMDGTLILKTINTQEEVAIISGSLRLPINSC